jgi:alpha-1,3-rhamnosyltransferase
MTKQSFNKFDKAKIEKEPLVSILLPSYNHCKYVEQAILSIINQTYQNIELIVIDDGSNDGSHEIIQSLHNKFNFFYRHRPNKGLIGTLNELASLASGKYISLFSSDDLSDKNKIAELVKYMEENPQLAMVYSKIRIIDTNNNILKAVEEPYREGYIFNDLLCAKFFINGIGALIKKDVYKNYSRFDCFIDDLQLWLKISKDHQIGFVNKTLSSYRLHDSHFSSNNLKMQQAELEIISKYKNEKIYPGAIFQWNLRWFNSFASNHKKIALKILKQNLLRTKSFLNLNFYKGLIKLIIPLALLKKLK